MAFPMAERERLQACLARLLPHLAQGEVALTGGVAIEWSLPDSATDQRRVTIADLDFVAKRLASIERTLSQDFRVSHYHVPQPGYPKFLVQVVDPITKIRVDIFPDRVGSIAKARPLRIGGGAHPAAVNRASPHPSSCKTSSSRRGSAGRRPRGHRRPGLEIRSPPSLCRAGWRTRKAHRRPPRLSTR
jgi:hypothetical protein